LRTGTKFTTFPRGAEPAQLLRAKDADILSVPGGLTGV